MKRRFTILTAALALLTFLAVPMGMWGQTRTVQTATYGFESGDGGWTATTFVTNNTAITAHGGSKYGATNGTTADVKYNAIVESPQSLTCYYSKTTTNTNANSKFHIQVSTNNSTWTTVASGLGMDQVTKGTWYELTADLSSYSNVYVRVRYDGTTGVRALDDIILTYDDGQSPSTDPEITFNPTSITLDNVMVGNQASTTFSVSQANLTSDIALSVDNGSLSPSSIAQGAAATTVTWTYTPTTAGAISATVTATSGEATETLAISGTAIAPVEGYDVDFEYATNMYPNWTFDNMTTYQTGNITAHGGTYYGTTGGKSTASITTTSTVANPGTLTCYVSKQSNNTTSSTWYIQVSSDGSTWTDVESKSATSMSQGSWTKFSADLSSYTDVYVRVYYSGSTAIRNIDDLTLTTVTPSPAVATTTTINVPQNFNTDIYQGTSAGTLTATVTVTSDGTPVSGATVTWESSNIGVATVDANGAVTLVAVGTTNITASYAGVEDEYRPSSAAYELTVIDSNAPGTVNNPYTVAQAIANTPSSGTSSNVYIRGIVSSFYSTSIVGDGSNFRYYISDDGTTATELLVYKGKGLNQATFTSADDLLVGDEVVICGGLTMYSNAPEVASGNYLYSWNRPSSTDPYITIESDEFELTAAEEEGYLEFTYGNFAPTSFDVMFCDANGNELSEDPDWILLAIEAPQGETGDFVYYYAEPNDGEARTAYFMVYDDDVYSNIVTVTQNAPVVDYVTLPFNWAGGTSGDLTAVSGVSGNSLSDYAVGNAPYRVKFDNTGDYILIKTNEQPAVVSVGIKKVGGDGNSSIIIQSSSNGSDFTDVETFSNPGAQNDIMTHVTTNAFNASDRYVRIYFNKPSGGANVGVGPITIKGIETYTLSNITGYSGEKDHYRLIASPVTVDPATAGMTTGDFDLYYFDQAEEDEWRNYEATAFNLVPGKGYLYAKEAIDLNQTYSFVLTGIPYAGTGTVSLDYTENAEFPGFNLIGNPFGTNANLDLPFYRLNQDGSALNTTTEQSQINVMEGVFVQATAATRTANFTQATGAKRISQLNVKVTRNRSAVLDNAIIRFDDGATLGKFQLNQDDTKVYFTEDNQDYAIVRSNNAGEMPVSFKAAENGNYTLSVEAENVEASYLHLIDNMTGADVDLLATPSYSFEARTTDYANRFRLVFNANGVDENNATASFAYFNGSSWTVSNMGEATLQVVDMMGRVVSTQAISGNTDINLNQAAGVYMLRLVNGENVMVQKVVVR